MKTMRGFSMLEMVSTVAIVGVVTALAAPTFRDIVASSRQTTAANLFVASFNAARNEAITRSTNIDITANKDQNNNPNWTAGWKITVTEAGTTDTLASYEGLHSELKVTGAPNGLPANPIENIATVPPTSFRYNRQGRLAFADIDGNGTYEASESMSGTLAITLCDKRAGEKGLVVVLLPIGRVFSTAATCN